MKTRTVDVKTPKGMIQATYGPIVVADVREHSFRDDVAQAELRQTVTRHYPSARANNSITDALFSAGEFDFSSSDFEQVRVVWINIPLGKTKQDVEKQLEKFVDATIYRMLADNVQQVLSAEQLHAIDSPDFDYSLESAQRSHIVMAVDDDGMPRAIASNGETLVGAVELDADGKITAILEPAGLQYSSKGFALNQTDDIDLRAIAEPIKQATVADAAGVIDEAKQPA